MADEPVIDMGYMSLPAELQQAIEADAARLMHQIGHDLDLFLDTARLVITRRWWSGRPITVISQTLIQRHIRVGFAKAGKLLLLLEDFGIIARSGRFEYTFAVEPSDLDAKLAEIRAAHAREASDVR